MGLTVDGNILKRPDQMRSRISCTSNRSYTWLHSVQNHQNKFPVDCEKLIENAHIYFNISHIALYLHSASLPVGGTYIHIPHNTRIKKSIAMFC